MGKEEGEGRGRSNSKMGRAGGRPQGAGLSGVLRLSCQSIRAWNPDKEKAYGGRRGWRQGTETQLKLI